LAQMIHYQDDAFALRLAIKTLKDSFLLDIDPEIFIDKAVDDILFVDRSLRDLISSLNANDRLIDREERFRDLFSTERVYVDFIDSVIAQRPPFSLHLAPFKEKLKESLDYHRNSMKDLGEALDSYLPNQERSADLVSQDEMNELLREGQTE
jgi:hypothetical protein